MAFGDELILAHYSLATATFEDRCVAAEAGAFDGFGIDPEVYLDARARGLTDDELVTMLDDHGVRMPELETIVLAQCSDPPAFRARLDDYWRVADLFGSDHLSAIVIPGTDIGVQAAALAQTAQEGRRHGVRIGVEFIPHLTLVGDLDAANEFVARAAEPDVGIVFDVLHHRCSGDTWPRLEHLDPASVVTVQLSDSPYPLAHDDYYRAATTERLLPGEGDLGLADFALALNELGCESPCSVEVLSTALQGLSPAELGAVLGRTSRNVLGKGDA
jgi:sugar phosphate isomerase/epimerase